MSNPFTLLDVDITASRQHILRQVTVAMRAGTHTAREIALAQKRLFDPHTRALAELEYGLDVRAWCGASAPVPATTEPPPFEVLEQIHEQAGAAPKAD
jgi:hypothetical protein